ncbi:MAG: PIN domain-containing protein [Deltaproteobacteria bacterium]|nr:PIN domain-containing protein [Deltaproteobacteria bacterium]
MKDKYVLDSSVWIEIERKNPAVLERVLPLIEKNQVCLVDLIVAELLRGAKTRKDFLKLKDGFSVFLQLSTKWESVAELAFNTGRRGFTPPLTDLYIAQCVLENQKTLVTHDKHFRHIAQVKPFEVILLK